MQRQEKKESIVLKLIRKKVNKYKTEKVVVYYNTVGKVKRIAKTSGCNAYYYNTVGKDSMLINFIKGKQQVIVVISTLEIGVDIPNIRYIIYVNRPRTLLNYI